LHPSIGNWDHSCRSHYVIRNSMVIWAKKMSRSEIEQGRARDFEEKETYFGTVHEGWWRKSIRWLRGLFKA
jgi:hypothetical protein